MNGHDRTHAARHGHPSVDTPVASITRPGLERRRPRSYADCFLMHVVLQPTIRSSRRRAFRRRLIEHARQLGVLLVQREGVCLVFGAEHVCTHAQRTRLLAWLDEQSEPRRFAAFTHQRLRGLMRSGEPPEEAFKALALHGDRERVRSLVYILTGKMVAQWVRYVEGRIP